MSILAFWWPIGVLLLAHTSYQISAKSIPAAMDPYAAVFFNYVIATVLAFCLWMFLGEDKSLSLQVSKMNWAPILMGLSITAVEVASVFMYKMGWNISIASTIGNIALAVVLVAVGFFVYKEVVTVNQLIGIGLCMAGLIFMNR